MRTHRRFTFRPATVLVWAALILPLADHAAEAQMFGPRTLGRTLRRQPAPGVSGDVRNLRNQRFIRGNRRATDFVGSDRTESREFVGLQQSGVAGTARSAVTGGLGGRDESVQVNQMVRRATNNRPYDPRLEVGFDYLPPPTSEVASEITRQLSVLTTGIEVLVEDRTAILRGVVASAADRQFAELLAGFEPGVSRVQNELVVAGDKEAIPPPPNAQD
jgi:hypothetical protein